MDNDDAPVGRVLTRREAVLLLGASGAALLTGSGFLRGLPLAGAWPVLIPTRASAARVIRRRSHSTLPSVPETYPWTGKSAKVRGRGLTDTMAVR